MTSKIRLGALDKETKEYTLPSKATKERQYECVECHNRVILRKGAVRVHHFAHHAQTNTCSYYDHPNEAQIHKDAKLVIQKLLNDKSLISFTWDCDNCSGFWGLEELSSFKYKEGDQAILEYRGPNGKWIADVALVNNGEIRCIIEIKNKHVTITPRPEPWFEVDATSLHNIINEQFESKKELEKETEGFTPPFIFNIPCIRNNIERKCYGSFCYKESWVRRIPGYNDKNSDNSCILCKTNKDYIPTYDGCTGKFQDGCIRLCQDCLVIDTYTKEIRTLYANDILRPKKVEWRGNGSIDVRVGSEEEYSKQEEIIIKSTPRIWNKGGQEIMWKQEIPCVGCGRSKYNPIFYNKKFHALCKLCLGNEHSQANILNKINEGKITTKEECLIIDD